MTIYRTTLWDLLDDDQYERLCECRSVRSDILPLARCFKKNKHMNSEDALDATADHLEANSQYSLSDYIMDNWDILIKKLEKF